MQDYDALVDGYDLGTNRAILVRQHIENAADGRRNPAIRTIRDDPEQLSCSIAALGRYNAEFGQVSAQGIAQHRALAHQQLPGLVQHQPFVLIGTNRIDSRVTASQIAAASFASFLPRLR